MMQFLLKTLQLHNIFWGFYFRLVPIWAPNQAFPLQQFKGKLSHKSVVFEEQIFQLDTLGSTWSSFCLSHIVMLGGRGNDMHLPYKPHIWSQALFLCLLLFLVCDFLSFLTQKCHHKVIRSFLSILTLHHHFASDQYRRKCGPTPSSTVATTLFYCRWSYFRFCEGTLDWGGTIF